MKTYFGKEVRIFLKGQAKESYLQLKKRNDKEAQSILNSIGRIKEIEGFEKLPFSHSKPHQNPLEGFDSHT